MFRKPRNIVIAVVLLITAFLAYNYFFNQTFFLRLYSKAKCPKCNVILVTLDTLGAKHVGLYGYNRPTTPFLDSFAKDKAIVFDEAIAQGSFTPTSHTSILTGKYPEEQRMFTSEDKLPPEAKTIAQVMSKNGYQNFSTQAVSAAILIQPLWGWDRGFDGFDEKWFVNSVTGDDAGTTFKIVNNWIKQNKSYPFFLFVNTNHLHSPHTPSAEALKKIGVDTPAGQVVDERKIVNPNLNGKGLTDKDMNLMHDYYDGEIRELDDVLKSFIGNLEQQGLMKNTIVIFEGDHSEQFGEHGVIGWFGTYEQQIHVPLIVYIPGEAPKRISPTVELRSIPATILDLVGIKPDPDFQGPSLLPLINGQKTEERVALTMNALTKDQNLGMVKVLLGESPSVWELMKSSTPPLVRAVGDVPKDLWHSAHSNDWHLIKNADGSLELYNVKRDPEELQNLIGNWKDLSEQDRVEATKVFEALKVSTPST